jgi:serine protease Do
MMGQQGQDDGQPITREGQSLGSGFVVSPDGYIVTNAHVITAAAKGKIESITVTLFNRKEYVAKVIGSDTASDLAVLKVDATNLPYVKFGDSGKARVGDWVIAIGEPFGLGGTVTAGIISALNRVTGQGGAYDRFIQTDAAINKGNSGGPMFDLNGNVIGINSQIYSPSEGSVGIGFAIPAASAKPIIDTMIKGGKVQRGYLGIGRQPVDEDIASTLGLPKDQGEIVNRVGRRHRRGQWPGRESRTDASLSGRECRAGRRRQAERHPRRQTDDGDRGRRQSPQRGRTGQFDHRRQWRR